jgi:hypothetical protein
MAWLRENEQEYKGYVQPVAVDRHHAVRHTHQETWFALQQQLHEAADKLVSATNALRGLHWRTAGTAGTDQTVRIPNPHPTRTIAHRLSSQHSPLGKTSPSTAKANAQNGTTVTAFSQSDGRSSIQIKTSESTTRRSGTSWGITSKTPGLLFPFARNDAKCFGTVRLSCVTRIRPSEAARCSTVRRPSNQAAHAEQFENQ